MVSLLLWALSLGGAPVEAPSPIDDDPPIEGEGTTPIAIVWEAGPRPVSPAGFMDALFTRLPPERFEAARPGATEQSWVVRVQQPRPGIYRLEVAPPGRRAEARILTFADPQEMRRRLALLTSFVLEQGQFPKVVEGSGILPDSEALDQSRDEDRPAPNGEGLATDASARSTPVSRARDDLRIVAGLDATAVFPTAVDDARGALGGGGSLALGLRSLRLLWTGISGDYSAHPGPGWFAHRVQGGVFVGVRPQLGNFHLGARVRGIGGVLLAVRGDRRGSVGQMGGALDLSAGWTAPGRGIGFELGVRAELVSGSVTVGTGPTPGDSDTARGFGTPRIVVGLGVLYASPRSLLRP